MVRKLFECYVCHKNFKSKKSNLLRHLDLHGPVLKRYKCPKCRLLFQNKSNYQRHWAKKHTGISIESDEPKIIQRQVKRTFF